MKPKKDNSAKRVAKCYEAKRARGLIRVAYWIPVEDKPVIDKFVNSVITETE